MLATIKFVTYSLPRKVLFSASSAGTPVPLIEAELAWNIRLGRCTGDHVTSKHSDVPENTPK